MHTYLLFRGFQLPHSVFSLRVDLWAWYLGRHKKEQPFSWMQSKHFKLNSSTTFWLLFITLIYIRFAFELLIKWRSPGHIFIFVNEEWLESIFFSVCVIARLSIGIITTQPSCHKAALNPCWFHIQEIFRHLGALLVWVGMRPRLAQTHTHTSS